MTQEIPLSPFGVVMRKARPVIKWVGSKRRESGRIVPKLQGKMTDRSIYYEPFAGSAAIFFALRPRQAVVNDILPELGVLYRALQLSPTNVCSSLQVLKSSGFDEVAFNRVRSTRSVDIFDEAARVIYLNKTAYNGLWRTNSKGEFNVPYAKNESPSFPTMTELKKAGDLLKRAVILTRNWTVPVLSMREGDVAFMDPPYTPAFTGYHGQSEDLCEVSIARLIRTKWEQGCHFVITHPDTKGFVEVMGTFADPYALERRTTVSQAGNEGKLEQTMWVSRNH